jgi:hypothetical protein
VYAVQTLMLAAKRQERDQLPLAKPGSHPNARVNNFKQIYDSLFNATIKGMHAARIALGALCSCEIRYESVLKRMPHRIYCFGRACDNFAVRFLKHRKR